MSKTATAAADEPEERPRNRRVKHHCRWVQVHGGFGGEDCGYVIPSTAGTVGGGFVSTRHKGAIIKSSGDPGGFVVEGQPCPSLFLKAFLFLIDMGGGWGAWLDVLIASAIGGCIGVYLRSRGWL